MLHGKWKKYKGWILKNCDVGDSGYVNMILNNLSNGG
jgi:hypothetical protein